TPAERGLLRLMSPPPPKRVQIAGAGTRSIPSSITSRDDGPAVQTSVRVVVPGTYVADAFGWMPRGGRAARGGRLPAPKGGVHADVGRRRVDVWVTTIDGG